MKVKLGKVSNEKQGSEYNSLNANYIKTKIISLFIIQWTFCQTISSFVMDPINIIIHFTPLFS